MFRKRSIPAHRAGFRRKRIFKKAIFVAMILVLLSLLPAFFIERRGQNINERRMLRELFESGSFEKSFEQSREMLERNPLDFITLKIHGFSAYQLALAQINSFDTLYFIDESIWALRRALLVRGNSPQIFYVLGKAYYYKGQGYADLAVKYLEKARAAGFNASDIPEYLGLAYAALGDYRSSVAAFSLALTAGGNSQAPSDVLLLSIARSYLSLQEFDKARSYLVHTIDISRDVRTKTVARLLLGNVLIQTGDLYGAEAEFLRLLEESGENAEAHFQLGELYAMQGDMTRARAEWRRALRINPAHGPARNRLSL